MHLIKKFDKSKINDIAKDSEFLAKVNSSKDDTVGHLP